MIDIDKCKKTFFEYIDKYDMSDSKISLKVIHTLKVLNVVDYITTKLNLDEENKNLALLIALLHDIGRFEQLRVYSTFDDNKSIDHAEYGVKILFEDGIIKNFTTEEKYYKTIYYAIKNHNKYKIEDGLDDFTLMHAKIIRDADKADNFRVNNNEDMRTLLDISEIELGKQEISDEIFNEFLEHKLLDRSKALNEIELWLSNIAFLFDFNYNAGIEYLLKYDYINKLFDRVSCSNKETQNKINYLKQDTLAYIENRLNNNNYLAPNLNYTKIYKL